MKNSLRFACSIALALPALAGAVGLGDIHISSALNQPLSAEIEVLNATPEELAQVRASLASRDTFARYGLERPSALNSLNFRLGKNAVGHPALLVRSNEAISEPFLSFLVEVDWPRGHLVREYAVLLDPPVYAPATAAAPVVAPTTGAVAARPSPSERAAVSASAPSATPAPTPAGAAEGAVRVGRGATLSGILAGRGITDGAELRRSMIATFRANPQAFFGNINRLRRGAVLNIPTREAWANLDAHDASQEIARQNEEWRNAGSSDTKLRLVPPPDTPAVSDGGRSVAADHAAAAVAASAPPANASDPRAALQAQLAEARHQIEVQNAELARIEAQLKTLPADTPAAAAVPAETATPAATPTPAAPAPKGKVVATPAAEPGFVDLLTDNALPILGGAVALLAAFLIGRSVLERRRRAAVDSAADASEEIEERYGGMAAGALDTHPGLAATPRAKPPVIEVTEHEGDATGEFQIPSFNSLRTQSIPHPATPGKAPPDSRIGAAQAIALEQTDPIAEADFNVSLGLYDQAVGILRLAIEQQPKRVDLALKLLEVYFIDGRRAEFLERARDYAAQRGRVPPGDWAQVVIMGRQIAPDDPLFASSASTPTGAMDFDVHSADADGDDVEFGAALASATTSADLPLSLRDDAPTLDAARFDALLEQTATTKSFGREVAAAPARPTPPPAEADLLDLVLEPTITTRPLPHQATAKRDPAADGMDLLLGGDAASNSAAASGFKDADLDLLFDAPTEPATSPDRRPGRDAAWADPEATLTGGVSESTAEISLEELGFEDTALDLGAQAAAAGETWADQELQKLVDFLPPEQTKPRATAPPSALPVTPPPARTSAPAADLSLDLADLARALEQDTMAVPTADRFKTDILATGVHPTRSGGASAAGEVDTLMSERKKAAEIDLPDLDPVTLSEVGTKLDLARAYLDMGDPDGARAILQEVLQEGGAAQQEEAKRLLGTLPG